MDQCFLNAFYNGQVLQLVAYDIIKKRVKTHYNAYWPTSLWTTFVEKKPATIKLLSRDVNENVYLGCTIYHNGRYIYQLFSYKSLHEFGLIVEGQDDEEYETQDDKPLFNFKNWSTPLLGYIILNINDLSTAALQYREYTTTLDIMKAKVDDNYITRWFETYKYSFNFENDLTPYHVLCLCEMQGILRNHKRYHNTYVTLRVRTQYGFNDLRFKQDEVIMLIYT
jgi:hypothetical protein